VFVCLFVCLFACMYKELYSFIVKDLCFCLLYNQVVNNHSFSICLKMFFLFVFLSSPFAFTFFYFIIVIIASSRCLPLYFRFLSFPFLFWPKKSLNFPFCEIRNLNGIVVVVPNLIVLLFVVRSVLLRFAS